MKRIVVAAFTLGGLFTAGCATTPDFSQMTPAQIQAYLAYQQQQTQQINALAAQANAASQQMLATSQQMQQSSSGYAAPAVQNPNQPSTTIKCIQAGIYVNCRD